MKRVLQLSLSLIQQQPQEEVNARSDDNDRKGIAMREKLSKAVLMLVALLVLPGLAWSRDAPQNLTLIVAGQPGQIPVVQMNGKSYVDIDALARLTNSSLSFKGNQVILTPPGSAPSTPAVAPEPSASGGQLKLVAERQPADPESEESKTAAPAKAAAGTGYASWPGGNSGCHGGNAGGGDEFRRTEKSGAESDRQPHQRPLPGQF